MQILKANLETSTKRVRSNQEVAVPPPSSGGGDPAEVRAPRPRLGQKVCAGKAHPLGFLDQIFVCFSSSFIIVLSIEFQLET